MYINIMKRVKRTLIKIKYFKRECFILFLRNNCGLNFKLFLLKAKNVIIFNYII